MYYKKKEIIKTKKKVGRRKNYNLKIFNILKNLTILSFIYIVITSNLEIILSVGINCH